MWYNFIIQKFYKFFDLSNIKGVLKLDNQNTVARVFHIVALIVWFAGFIVGINMGFSKTVASVGLYTDEAESFNFLITIVIWFVFFVFGMLLYGFGEIIQKLSDVDLNLTKQNDSLIKKWDQLIQAIGDEQASKDVSLEPQKPMKKEITSKPAVTSEVTEDHLVSDDNRVVERSEAMVEDGYLLCPYCNKVQKATRKDCYHCGAKFID